jgi:DNA primase
MILESEFIEEVRSKVRIENLIGEYLPINKTGSNLTSLCPFHKEKTASFSINTDKQFFFCFGCKVGGDCFKFLTLKEGYSFTESVIFLAEYVGLALPDIVRTPEYTKKQAVEKAILEMNRLASNHWFEARQNISEYLEKRQFSEETIDSFKLGYSLDSKDTVCEILKHAGFEDVDIIESGLVVTSKNGYEFYDRFRDRLMIPTIDIKGRIVAFGGRSLGNDTPKYLNSPETPLYVKGEHLFGLFQAKESIRQKGFVILTEGYLDTISLHQAGITNTVASLGTSFTKDQAELLKRFTDKVVICFDGDSAGQKAASKAGDILNNYGFVVKVLILPDGDDPDSFIRTHGASQFSKCRATNSLSWFQYYIHSLKEKYDLSIPKYKSKAITEVLKTLSSVSNDIEKREYFDFAVKTLLIDSSLHNKLWKRLASINKNITAQDITISPSLAELKLLDLVVANPQTKINIDDIPDIQIKPILIKVVNLDESNFHDILENFSSVDSKALVYEAVVKTDAIKKIYANNFDAEINNCITTLKIDAMEKEFEKVATNLQSTEDTSKVEEIMQTQMDILKKLAKLRESLGGNL